MSSPTFSRRHVKLIIPNNGICKNNAKRPAIVQKKFERIYMILSYVVHIEDMEIG